MDLDDGTLRWLVYMSVYIRGLLGLGGGMHATLLIF